MNCAKKPLDDSRTLCAFTQTKEGMNLMTGLKPLGEWGVKDHLDYKRTGVLPAGRRRRPDGGGA